MPQSREELLARKKQYRAENREKIRAYNAEYAKTRVRIYTDEARAADAALRRGL